MQPLDPHTLFSIFEKGDAEVYEEHNMTELLDNPYVLMGMVLRGIDNYHTMDLMHMKHFGKQYRDVRFKVRNQFYNKLYGYLNKVDTTKFETKYTITKSFDSDDVFGGLNVLLLYFEHREEYEKCATIKRYQDLLKKEVEIVA
tara:strand:+ start:1015 stop:1443 length:429 start_codon:yes stop_codon:yes gene_type:complete